MSYTIGLASEQRMRNAEKKNNAVESIIAYARKENIKPDEINSILKELETPAITHKTKIASLLLRPQISIDVIAETVDRFREKISECGEFITEISEQSELLIKYDNYIQKEKEMVDKMSRLENMEIKNGFDYHQIKSLSSEAREKLSKLKPQTLGQASRISGVSPADISVLIVYMGR
jgi:tRNA uridine 5-carboxymethylaminomethyl modification enzyme